MGQINSEQGAQKQMEETLVRDLMYCAGVLRYHTDGKGSQRRVLCALHRCSPMTQREMLEEMGVRPASLSELLSKMEAKGFIRKEKSEEDKRNQNLFLTDAGKQALEEMQAQHVTISELLSGLTQEEGAQLAELLAKLRGQWQERIPRDDRRDHDHRHPHWFEREHNKPGNSE